MRQSGVDEATRKLIRTLTLIGHGVQEICEEAGVVADDVLSVRRELRRRHVICSPYGMVQERVPIDPQRLYPWRIAVTSSLMNRTTGRHVRTILIPLFARWPAPSLMATAGTSLEELLYSLGFAKVRAERLRIMSREAAYKPIEQCYGVGKYGSDCLEVFVKKRTDLEVEDHWLEKYLDWVRGGRKT